MLFLKSIRIYLWLRWVFTAACGLSLVVAKGAGATLCCRVWASHRDSFFCRKAQHLECAAAVAHKLWSAGSASRCSG